MQASVCSGLVLINLQVIVLFLEEREVQKHKGHPLPPTNPFCSNTEIPFGNSLSFKKDLFV